MTSQIVIVNQCGVGGEGAKNYGRRFWKLLALIRAQPLNYSRPIIRITKPLCLTPIYIHKYRVTLVVTYHGWVVFGWDDPSSCPTIQPVLPNSYLPKQNPQTLEHQDPNQPNPGRRPAESPCRAVMMLEKEYFLQAASHIASLRAEAQADEEYLEKETRYLKSLGAASEKN